MQKIKNKVLNEFFDQVSEQCHYHVHNQIDKQAWFQISRQNYYHVADQVSWKIKEQCNKGY